eukprot:COSAG01_NODE_17029_length_1183_cov_4.323801_1_plen_56_part_10
MVVCLSDGYAATPACALEYEHLAELCRRADYGMGGGTEPPPPHVIPLLMADTGGLV